MNKTIKLICLLLVFTLWLTGCSASVTTGNNAGGNTNKPANNL